MLRSQSYGWAICVGLPLAIGLGSAHLMAPSAALSAEPAAPASENAATIAVSVRGEPQAYTFAVQVRSPDAGCAHYANWWEVVTPDGKLLYRRILLHSHKDEQPFTRTGGPVPITADQEVIVRVHVHPEGYSRNALRGSAKSGFSPVLLAEQWGQDLARQAPLPDSCAF